MSGTPEWYVLHTYSGYENSVASTVNQYIANREDLRNLICKVHIPTETVIEPVKVKKKVVRQEEMKPGKFIEMTDTVEVTENRQVERKLLPGYVLVKMVLTDKTWHIIRNIRGVTGFVGADLQETGMNGVPLNESELTALGIDITEDENETVNVNLGFAEGDKVRVISGPYSGNTAVVDEIDAEREMVYLSVFMFGREIPAEAELSQVEPIRED